MVKSNDLPIHVIIDGHEVNHHVIAVDLNTPLTGTRTLVIELVDPAVHTDPATGQLTFRIGKEG